MKHYIDKSALVAEIKSRISDIEVSQKAGLIKKRDADKKILLFKSVLSLIDTLEVKEVNLDESARHYLLHEHVSPLNEVLHQADLKVEMQYHKDIEGAYKAGFELGLKARIDKELHKEL